MEKKLITSQTYEAFISCGRWSECKKTWWTSYFPPRWAKATPYLWLHHRPSNRHM